MHKLDFLHQSLITHLPNNLLYKKFGKGCYHRNTAYTNNVAKGSFVVEHTYDKVVAFHILVMKEMVNRGLKFDKKWLTASYHGPGRPVGTGLIDTEHLQRCDTVYEEHTPIYLLESVNYLQKKGVIICLKTSTKKITEC